jgi:hypothetical protein
VQAVRVTPAGILRVMFKAIESRRLRSQPGGIVSLFQLGFELG